MSTEQIKENVKGVRVREDRCLQNTREGQKCESLQVLLTFDDVINCTAQTDKKTEQIKIIVKATEKYKGVEATGWEEVEDGLKGGRNLHIIMGWWIIMVISILQ